MNNNNQIVFQGPSLEVNCTTAPRQKVNVEFIDWVSGAGVPQGGTTGQILKKKTNTNYDTEWTDNIVPWGNITGSINNQTDLSSSLASKANDNEVVKIISQSLSDTEKAQVRKNISADGFVVVPATADNGINVAQDWSKDTSKTISLNPTVRGQFGVGGGHTISGAWAFAEGNSNTSSGNASHAEGTKTTASGSQSHAEGGKTIAIGTQAHAEGYATVASGRTSHAEGFWAYASGSYSHASGLETVAYGQNAHSEGMLTAAIGDFSKTILGSWILSTYLTGQANTTTYTFTLSAGDLEDLEHIKEILVPHNLISDNTNYTLIESVDWTNNTVTLLESINPTAAFNSRLCYVGATVATGKCSLAGRGIAQGESSIAIGVDARAYNTCSVAIGNYVDAINKAETAVGEYNITTQSASGSEATIFTVGNGTAKNSRKNAFELKKNGDLYLNGVGGYVGTNASSSNSVQTILASKGNASITFNEDGSADITNGTTTEKFLPQSAVAKWGVMSQTQTWTRAADLGYDYAMSNLQYGWIPQSFIDDFLTYCKGYGAFNQQTGYFELNGLTDISYEEARIIKMVDYCAGANPNSAYDYATLRTLYEAGTTEVAPRTIVYRSNFGTNGSALGVSANSKVETMVFNPAATWYAVGRGYSIAQSPYISLNNFYYAKTIQTFVVSQRSALDWSGAYSLENLKLSMAKTNVNLKDSSRLTAASVAFLVKYAQATPNIVITLHATAYARAIADAEVQTQLAAHTNVTLAQAS